MACTDDLDVLRQQRDAIAFLGVASYLFLNWDAPQRRGPGINDVTHHNGLNIAALVIDNCDGEVLSLEKNSIHRYENPLQHAELRAICNAIERLKVKRPRLAEESVEEFYLNRLMYSPKDAQIAFLYGGCTLYTSLEPCPMCTAVICVCRTKRTVYFLSDTGFGGSFRGGPRLPAPGVKGAYYGGYTLEYGALELRDSDDEVVQAANRYYETLLTKIGEIGPLEGSLRDQKVYDTLALDFLREDLSRIYEYFRPLGVRGVLDRNHIAPQNRRLLVDLQTWCSLPKGGD